MRPSRTSSCSNAGSSSLKFCVYRRPAAEAWRLGRARPDRGHRDVAATLGEGRRRRVARRSKRSTRRSRDGARRARRRSAGVAARALRRRARARRRPSRRPRRRALRRPDASSRRRCWRSCGRWSRWRRCISRTTSRRSTRSPSGCPACRRSPASTRASTAASRPVAELVPLPREIRATGVQRYGFHGLSYEYIASVLPQVAPEIADGRVIVAHLGSGASLCALRERQERRQHASGSRRSTGCAWARGPAPSIPAWSCISSRASACSAKEVETILYKKSGLLGISGISNDMRDLLASARAATRGWPWTTSSTARPRRSGRSPPCCGGIDGLVFTAGIGENSAEIRGAICEASAWLGVDARSGRPTRSNGPRHLVAAGSRVSAWVIPTNEELMIARHTTARLLGRLAAVWRDHGECMR